MVISRARRLRQPAEQQAEVVARGGEHGVDAVALSALETIAIHAVLGFHVADDSMAARHVQVADNPIVCS
jgi:hypothetical protein